MQAVYTIYVVFKRKKIIATTNPFFSQSLEIAIQKCDDVIIGSNVTFSFAVTNRSEGTKLVGAVLMMTPTCYNGVLRDTVHKYRFDDVSISPDEGKGRADVTRKEGNVLFNDTLNTFYLRLYGVGHMVKDCSDSWIGNPLPPLHFSISSKGSFICIIPQTG